MNVVLVNPCGEQSAPPPVVPTVTDAVAVLPGPPVLLGVAPNVADAVMFTIWLFAVVGVATPGPVHA